MSQILDPIPSGEEGKSILCSYINVSNQMQVARITNIPNWYFERVVFPGQRLVFEAISSGVLEIHSGMMASAILSDSIPCQRLAIQDSPEVPSREAKQQSSQSAIGNSTSAMKNKVKKPNASAIKV